MEWVKLGKIIKITSGGTPNRSHPEYYENGVIPWVKTGDLKEKYIIDTPEKITSVALQNSSAKLFPPNTVLVALYGATIGACSILKIEATTNQACAALLPDKRFNPEFLYYYFKFIRKQLIQKGQGGGQPNISGQILKDTKIPLLKMENQNRIANLLSKAEGLICKRKKTLLLLDELVHSKYSEMFGSLKNEKIPFSNACIINPPKSELSKIDRSIEVSFIPMASVSENGEVDLSQTRTIESVWTGFTYFRENDVAFAKITPCMENGKGAILRNLKNNIGFGTTEFHILRPIQDVTNAEWIYYLTMQSSFRRNAERNMTGTAGQKRVPSDFFSKYKVTVPPYSLQKEFAQFVSLIHPIKAKLKNSLFELENLYQSLMQKAFKGELSLKEDVEWLNTTGDIDDSEQPESEYFKKEIEKLSKYREPEEVKADSDTFLKQLISFQKSVQKLKTPYFPENLIKQTKALSQIAEDANKISKLINPNILKAINSLAVFQNSPALKASIEASKNYEKILQVASKYSQAGNAIFENTFEKEMSDIIKNNFAGADFNFQMIVELLENEKAIVPVYLTSQELKDNYSRKDKSSKELLNERDIKSLIFDSIEGKNPYLKIEQFYHNERQNPDSLKLLSKYEEQYKKISTDERSGIYFKIVQ